MVRITQSVKMLMVAQRTALWPIPIPMYGLRTREQLRVHAREQRYTCTFMSIKGDFSAAETGSELKHAQAYRCYYL